MNIAMLSENRIWPMQLLILRLSNEIDRSAENETDIAFVVFRLGNEFRKNDTMLHSFEKILLENFRYVDMIYHLDPYYYGIILPDREPKECLKEIIRFLQITRDSFLETKEIYAGYSTRGGRLMGGDRLFKESFKSASMASPNKGRIINFRPDSDKYQAHLLGVASLKNGRNST